MLDAEGDLANEIHLWVLDLERSLFDLEILSRDEEERAGRLVRPSDQRQFRAARASVRQILGRYLKQGAGSLVFETTEVGKPFLQVLGQPHQISFNLSHGARYGLLAVTHDREVGVDIEVERFLEDLPGMARQIMSPGEWRSFRSISPELAQVAFLGLWTRKEALLKAIGKGFLIDPREIDLGLASAETKVVEFGGGIWSVGPVSVFHRTKAAIAVEGDLPCIRIFLPDAQESQLLSMQE
jgi:4'-phosphopantetheinyl transferase